MLPASAAPVESTRVAEVRLELPAGDGTSLHLMIFATRGSAGDALQVSAVSCGRTCGVERYFSGALSAGAFDIDAQQASGRLRTSLGGLPVSVTWAPQVGVGVERGFVDGNGSASLYRGDNAVASVALAGRGCQGRATVGTQVDVSLARPSGGFESLSRLRLPAAGGAPRCTG
jgi:hypothetical protein